MASLKDLIVRGPARFLDKLYGNLEGNASSASWLNANSSLTYGANGFQYFNLSGTQGTSPNSNNTPTSGWYHIMRLNHANSSGFFADIAVPLNDIAGIYWRQIRGGTNYGWYKILDSNNYTNYTVTKTGGGASGTWGIDISGGASYLKPHNSAVTYTSSTWGNMGTNVWGMAFKNTALGTDSGDIGLSLTKYSDSQVILNLKIDGQINAGSVRSDGIGFIGNLQGNASTATKLATARNITTNLASTSAASFNGTANITPGVTGTLPLGNGGTGVTSLNDLRRLFREWAPINSSNDTTSNWGVKGLSVAGYGDGNTLTDKPSNWGIVLNMNTSDTEVHQLWFTQASGRIFHRGGNSSGWNGSWRLMYSDGDSIIYSSSEPTDRVKGTIWLKPA